MTDTQRAIEAVRAALDSYEAANTGRDEARAIGSLMTVTDPDNMHLILAAIAAVEAERDALRARLAATTDGLTEAMMEREKLRAALEKIERWELPGCGPCSYEAVHGVRAAKELMRTIARVALRSALAAQPKAEPVDALRARVRDAIAENLGDVYVCTRVWSAWGVGTMSQDDFSPAGEDDGVLDALTDAALAAQPDGRVS